MWARFKFPERVNELVLSDITDLDEAAEAVRRVRVEAGLEPPEYYEWSMDDIPPGLL